MNEVISQLTASFDAMRANLHFAAMLLAVMWGVQIVNMLVGYRLNIFGVYPRNIFGLVGIPSFSFLHGSLSHLFFNSIPLLVLADFVLLQGIPKFFCVSSSIILISGTALWLFGRKALHIGASCLVMGYWSYLMVNAYEHYSINSIILAIICVYYFGGLALSLFPSEERVSWEGHIFGFLAGLATVFICNGQVS